MLARKVLLPALPLLLLSLLAFSAWGQRSKGKKFKEWHPAIVDPLDRDERLKVPVSVRAKKVSVRTLLNYLSEKGGVPLQPAQALLFRQVTIVIDRRPLKEVMRALGFALDAKWEPYGKGYLLSPVLDQRERYTQMLLARAEKERMAEIMPRPLSDVTSQLLKALDPQQKSKLQKEGLPISELPFDLKRSLFASLKSTPTALLQPGRGFTLRDLYLNGAVEVTVGLDPLTGLPGGVMRLYPAGGQGPVLTIPYTIRPFFVGPPRPSRRR